MKTAYLDIETSFQGEITIIGIYVPGQGTQQLIGDEISTVKLLSLLEGISIIKTYNGDRFDLPVIKKRLGVDLKTLYSHEDIMFHCWKHQLKGGLKSVERQLGLQRETEGVDGMQAMSLWAAWIEQKDDHALELLLKYNREDIEFLEKIEKKLILLEKGINPLSVL